MLTPDVRAALLTLGEQLGKYDAQIQRRALDTCIETLQAAAAQMQADTTQRGNSFAASARRLVCSPPWLCLITQEALMDVDLVFKIAAIGILVAVLNILLSRAGRDEQALMTTIAGLVVVLVLVIQKISELFDLIKSLFSL